MSNPNRFPLFTGQNVAEILISFFWPYVERIAVAGSVRRDRADVGDLDLILIPRFETRADPGDLFGTPRPINLFEEAVATLIV
jgi:DNA polymerase/3'-5' exonuclease PolX